MSSLTPRDSNSSTDGTSSNRTEGTEQPASSFPRQAARWAVLLALALTALSPNLVHADDGDDESDPPPSIGVFRSEAKDPRGREITVTETVLPGAVLAVAPWPAKDGGGIAVLLASEPAGRAVEDDDSLDERARALYRLRGREGDLQPRLGGLSSELDSLALAPGGDELWLGEAGILYRLRGGSLETLLEQPGLDLGAIVAGGLMGRDTDGRAWLATPSVGRFRLWDVRPDRLVLRYESSLPVTVRRKSLGLELRGLPTAAFAGASDGSLFAAGPGIESDYRSRHLLIDPMGRHLAPTAEPEGADKDSGNDGGSGSGSSSGSSSSGSSESGTDTATESESPPWMETWTRTDEPEDIDAASYVLIDGRPALITSNTQADKLGIFEKIKLRVFRLRSDRTRAGKKPMLAVKTATRNWYRVDPTVLDYDGDGKDDLALVQPEGLGAGKLVVDLFKGRGGSFESTPRRTKLDIEASAWHFGHDFDGDGTGDLFVLSGKLRIFRGIADHRRKLLEKTPWLELDAGQLARSGVEVSIEVGSEGSHGEDRGSLRGRLRLLELDEDPGPEILIYRHVEGRAVVRRLDFTP